MQRPIAFLPGDKSVNAPMISAALHHKQEETAPFRLLSGGGGAHLLEFDDVTVSVMLIPSALPDGEVNDDVSQKIVWQFLGAQRPLWTSHVIVSPLTRPTSPTEAVTYAKRVLEVSGFLCKRNIVLSVGWVPSGLFLPAGQFAGRIENSPIPVELVTRCVFSRSQSGELNAQTRGLAALGLQELGLTLKSGQQPVDVYRSIMNVASYMIEHGATLNDGDTLSGEDGVQFVAKRTDQGSMLVDLEATG